MPILAFILHNNTRPARGGIDGALSLEFHHSFAIQVPTAFPRYFFPFCSESSQNFLHNRKPWRFLWNNKAFYKNALIFGSREFEVARRSNRG
jgi:hypothetical protein